MKVHDNLCLLAPDERPGHKLMSKGPQGLSDAELLTLLLGSHSPDDRQLILARTILNSLNHDWQTLGAMKWQEMAGIQGITRKQALTLAAACELARRKISSQSKRLPVIRHSRDVYERLLEFMWNLPHEEFWVVSMSRANRVISLDKISEGGLSATIADPKKVFRIALINNAASIIVAHNHPSGNREPSNEDRQLTKRLVYCGQMLECPVIDHLVVTDNGYYSFCDENELKE
jgi:DNA repair protein RadC